MRFPLASAFDGTDRWPVGSVFVSLTDASPADLLGFGAWQEVGQGRVLVGLDVGQAEFDALGKTGGAKEVALTVAQMPAHAHTKVASNAAGTSGTSLARGSGTQSTQSVDSAGGGEPHSNLQPYLVARFWRRTA